VTTWKPGAYTGLGGGVFLLSFLPSSSLPFHLYSPFLPPPPLSFPLPPLLFPISFFPESLPLFPPYKYGPSNQLRVWGAL